MAFVPPPYLAPLRRLPPGDGEFHRVAYQLRLALNSVRAEVLAVHSVNTPQEDAVFEYNHSGTTVVDAWMPSADLTGENTVRNIVEHSGRFRITDPNRGAVFVSGRAVLEPGQVQHEFVLFRVATGRSFVVDREQVGAHGIPAGYDSITIHKPAPDPADAPGPGGDRPLFEREYVVNDESRVYPAYVVSFAFDPATDALPPLPAAERPRALGDLQSTVGLQTCPKDNMPMQYFDPVLHEPLCIRCKMTGSHSAGQRAKHPLVPIQEAFQASLQDMEREAHIIDERRRTLQAQLGAIDRRMQAVNANHEKCQDQIYEIVQRAVQILHEETQSKLSALLSDESELRRQLEYYDWMENFLGDQAAAVDHIEFLRAFKSHSATLARAPSEIVDAAQAVRADLLVVGNLDIAVDSAHAPPPPPPPQQQQQQTQQQAPRQPAAPSSHQSRGVSQGTLGGASTGQWQSAAGSRRGSVGAQAAPRPHPQAAQVGPAGQYQGPRDRYGGPMGGGPMGGGPRYSGGRF